MLSLQDPLKNLSLYEKRNIKNQILKKMNCIKERINGKYIQNCFLYILLHTILFKTLEYVQTSWSINSKISHLCRIRYNLNKKNLEFHITLQRKKQCTVDIKFNELLVISNL